jgi:Tfp pilus assembly protein PilV
MHHRKQTCGGFALLITVVLTALLVLILVSMASLVRVETQVASNTQRLQVARQNALFGLQVALGQLQKYAGPDQRVTARADLTATATNPTPNPYYTGVWDAGAAATAAGEASTRTATEENAGRLNPLLPSVWLVSGNEANQNSNLNPSPISNPILINQDTTSADMREPVTLVKASGTGASGQVVVPKVEIKSDQVPGYSGQQTVGNYAYWVGDEGVKAKLNVVDPYTPRPAIANAAAFTPTSLQSYYRGVSAQRFGVEAVEDAATASTQLADLYKPTANTEDSATLLRNLNNAHHYTAASLAGVDRATLSARFHDLTAYSNGLLTNTAAGGLRRDLSWHFAQPDATDGLDQTSLLYKDSVLKQPLNEQHYYNPLQTYKNAIPYSINPKWQALKAFYNTPVVSDATAVVLPKDDNTTNPILPILLQARFFFGCRSDATGTYLDTYVAFVLANPYNVTLNVNPVRFKFKLRKLNPADPCMIKITVTPGSQDPVVRDLVGDNPAPLNGSFLTPSFTIAPGKVKVFSLAANTAPGTPDALLMDGLDINNAVSVPLSPTPFTPSPTSPWKLNFNFHPNFSSLAQRQYTLVASD